MRWILTAIKQLWFAVFSVRNDTIEISRKLFDEITPVAPGHWVVKGYRKRRKSVYPKRNGKG